MISLRQLRFVVALADELSFSRAAGVCNVTQPTLSAGLRELERALGVQVAERTKRSVIMTPIGRDIAERGRAVLASVQDIEDVSRRVAQGGVTEIRLGAIPTVGPYLLPRALPEIRVAFPGLRLYLREELSEELLDGLVSGRLDVILLAQPFALGDVEAELLFEDDYQLAMHPGAAAGVSGPQSGSALEGARLMLLERGHCLQRHALAAFPDAHIDQDESFSATSLPTLISMVEEGLGITLLPQLAVDGGAVAGHRLALAPLVGACPRRVVLAWRRTSARGEEFRRLAEILRQVRAGLARPAAAEPD